MGTQDGTWSPILAGMWELWAGVKVPGAELEGRGTREGSGDREQGKDQGQQAHPCWGWERY